MAFDLKAELLAAIDKAADQRDRTMLMLMFGLFEATQQGINEISGKIDMVLRDEQGLRDAVLNGHAKNHDRDHTWIAEQISYREQASEERRWVRDRMAANCSDACDWARVKMTKEVEAEKTSIEDAKADKRVARDALIRTVVAAVASAAVSALSVLAYMK